MNDLAASVELEHEIVRWSSQNVNSLAFIYNTAQNKRNGADKQRMG